MTDQHDTTEIHSTDELTDEQALLDAALHGSDTLLAESLRSEERRRRRRRRVTLCFLIGGVLMSAIAIALTASWFLAVDSPGQPTAGKLPDSAVQFAAVDRQTAVEQAEGVEQEGWNLWKERKYDEAIAKFQSAVQLDPDSANAWNGLGWAQFNSGKAEPAIKSFLKCVAAEPKHPAGLNGLGQAYFSLKDYKKAETYFKKAAPQAPAAWYGLGRLYLLTGKYPEAKKWLAKAAADQPDDPTLKTMLAAADAGELGDELRKQIEPAPAGKSKGPDVQRAWQLFFQGKQRSAERLFRDALAADPENGAAMNGLGFCLLNSGKATEAKPYFEKCIAKDKKAYGPMNGLRAASKPRARSTKRSSCGKRSSTKFPA